jgi:prepilin-type N-terminal cleavage/methylation domain-containing protein
MSLAKRQVGFSLVEVIVVTAIITIGFMGVLTLVQRTIAIYGSNQNYLVASIMAQEGLELVRNVRDDNWLTGQYFYQNLAQYAENNTATIFAIDHQATANRTKIIQLYNSKDGVLDNACYTSGQSASDLTSYIKNPCAAVYVDSTNKAYTEQVIDNISASAQYHKTIFSRLLEVTYHDNGTPNDPTDDYFYVSSMVYWSEHGAERYLTLGTYLYDYSWKYQKQ